MKERTKRTLSLFAMFFAFIFLEFTVLGIGNHAGEGFLGTDRRELVYYEIQVFVIIGFILYAAVRRAVKKSRITNGALFAALCVFFVGAMAMLFAESSFFSLVAAFAAVAAMGFCGGAVYERMGEAACSGERAALVMGTGYAAAVALQYLLVLKWGITLPLYIIMPAAFVLLSVMLLRVPYANEKPRPANEARRTTKKQILMACLICAALLLFTSFYNGYIHHLQVVSGYTDFNVYSWPRLMLIPCYLLFAAIGDRQKGRAVPAVSFCIALAALLNCVLTSDAGAYTLNMCLFYCAIAGAVSYYNLTFWRLSKQTNQPALWASMGRILDSAMVLITFGLHISALPAVAVLAVDIAALAAVILLMTLVGAKLSSPSPRAAGMADISIDEAAPDFQSEDVFLVMKSRYSLTNREAEVLRELVLTEDKQTVIGDRLSIRPRTVQAYVTSLYQKTGVSTRAGLTDLYHETLRSR
ncbi:MAG: response regulator transcription factor [Clostridia bacterium]|nr:response regulator transcription factor [Clostridia bacterium]